MMTSPNRDEMHWLRGEIALLEKRLAELSEGRDSAYEKALMRGYETMIRDCRERLGRLAGAR
jgi:hypothetical protein